jgi:hypothetical protein
LPTGCASSADRTSSTSTVVASRNAAGAAIRASVELPRPIYQPETDQTSRFRRAASAAAATRQSAAPERYA